MSASGRDDEQIITYLKGCREGNTSLHDHLCELLTSLPSDQLNGVAHFERLSEYFKKVRFEPKLPQAEEQVKPFST